MAGGLGVAGWLTRGWLTDRWEDVGDRGQALEVRVVSASSAFQRLHSSP